jgi:glycosyltransferase involved in cell wall biosynthesis
MLQEGVSVIICCYNSSSRIRETLQHIALQDLTNINCEVILVDNSSTDGTAELAKAIWKESKTSTIDFIVAYEANPGLSHARKKGVEVARYEYIIFCDDDNWLDKDYIKNTCTLFESSPDTAVLGGIGSPVFEDPPLKPFWFDNLYHAYAVGPQGNGESFINTVYGAGMAIRKSALNLAMHKPLFLSDRSKNDLSSGGDSEICLRLRLAGYMILYSPQLTFKHYITTKRLSWDYLKKLHAGLAKSFVILNLYQRALTSGDTELSPLFWLKQALYYWGIYIKYWPKHQRAIRNGAGSVEEIHKTTWKNIAQAYWGYNIKTVSIFRDIVPFKNVSNNLQVHSIN